MRLQDSAPVCLCVWEWSDLSRLEARGSATRCLPNFLGVHQPRLCCANNTPRVFGNNNNNIDNNNDNDNDNNNQTPNFLGVHQPWLCQQQPLRYTTPNDFLEKYFIITTTTKHRKMHTTKFCKIWRTLKNNTHCCFVTHVAGIWKPTKMPSNSKCVFAPMCLFEGSLDTIIICLQVT